MTREAAAAQRAPAHRQVGAERRHGGLRHERRHRVHRHAGADRGHRAGLPAGVGAPRSNAYAAAYPPITPTTSSSSAVAVPRPIMAASQGHARHEDGGRVRQPGHRFSFIHVQKTGGSAVCAGAGGGDARTWPTRPWSKHLRLALALERFPELDGDFAMGVVRQRLGASPTGGIRRRRGVATPALTGTYDVVRTTSPRTRSDSGS